MAKSRNEKPHLLTVKVQSYGRSGQYKGVSWTVQCPYGLDDIHDCGMIEECTGSEEDAAKWGCTPRPVEPRRIEDTADNRSAWNDYLAAEDEWQDDHVRYSDGYGHRIGECWFTHILAEGDVEPEDILKNIPDDTPINGPFKVEVHYEGSYDEVYPSFTLWKEAADGDQS